jgi:hypothetical protein
VAAQANAGFAALPEPPELGIYGSVVVRWRGASKPDPIGAAIADSLSGHTVLGATETSRHETGLGTGTRCLHRFEFAGSALAGTETDTVPKMETPVVEHLTWYWALELSDGQTILFTVTSVVSDLERAVIVRDIVDAFAAGIQLAA